MRSRLFATLLLGGALLSLPLWAEERAPDLKPRGTSAVGVVAVTDLGECAGCAGSVARALGRVDGVAQSTLHDDPAGVEIVFGAGAWVAISELRQSVRNVGYTAGSIWVRSFGSLVSDGNRATFAPRGRATPFEVEIIGKSRGDTHECSALLHWSTGAERPRLTSCEEVGRSTP